VKQSRIFAGAIEGIIVTVPLFVGLGALALVLCSAACSPDNSNSNTSKASPRAEAAGQPVSTARQIQPWGQLPLSAETETTLKARDSFKECPECPEMVVVPAGSFMMGTPADEPVRHNGEDPVHRVTIAKPFAVGRFAVTFDEWDACLADGGCNGITGKDGGFGRGRMPAQGLSYDDVQTYLVWISKKAGRTYRLPSESEREYFTRAGTTTPFWFGKIATQQDANYDAWMPYAESPRGETSKGPKPVDSYAPNPFGLYQVSGNIFEWTQDCFNKRYNEDKPSDGRPWLDGDCSKRMTRGGRWSFAANMLRSGYRNAESADFAGTVYGFRVVRDLTAAQ